MESCTIVLTDGTRLANPQDVPPDPPPSPAYSEDDAEDDAAEDLPDKILDKIVDEQLWQGRLYYRVAWEGGAHPDEWVPADHDAWLDGTTTNVLPIWQAHKATQRPLGCFVDVSDKSDGEGDSGVAVAQLDEAGCDDD